MSEIEELRTQLAERDGWLKEIAAAFLEAGADGNLGIVEGAKALLASAVAERDNWIETARTHAKNEAYYRDLIVTTLTGTPAAFVSDDGSVQQDVLCAKLPELYATAVSAREEAERERDAQTEIARTVLRTAEELGAKLAEAQREKARVFSVTAIGHDGCGKDHADHLPEFNVCWICKWEAAEAERDQLRERLDKEEEERGRQYGMRVQAEERAAFLLELLRATVRTGTKDPLLDARLAEEIRSHE